MNAYSKRILAGLLVLIACFLCTIRTFGQKQPVIAAIPLVGDSVKAGKTLTVQDTLYLNSSLRISIAHTTSVDNIVSLHLDEYSTHVLPDTFHVTVRIQVNYMNADSSTGYRLDTLNINYSKNHLYDSKAIKFYQDYYSLQVQILNVSITAATATDVQPLLVMENMMSIDRNFKTNCSVISTVSSSDSALTVAGELSVSWPAVELIPAYDLEWTYIDKAAIDSGNYTVSGQLNADLIFKNNSTRLSLTKNSYRIPMLYDGDGSVFFRVRTLQNAPDGEVIKGAWSTDAGSGGLGQYDYTGHERGLNWQATTSYAEEGKSKTVAQYFSGDLKGRQTVTKDNTTGRTIVAETLYDKQGRPAIQVLPSPTLSRLIGYAPLFNVHGINTAEYDKSVYDTLITGDEYCSAGSDSMSSTTGSAQYYSSLNPLLADATNFHKYVPNADGYPFTETRYTRDNTGRIDRQGGVGPTFQIGTGKETRYFYASPSQKQLDALFGTEAGDASHYERNMVRDANGQYSIAYVDMRGKTIATALAGNAPSTLQQLPSFDSVAQTDQLLTPTNNIIKDNTIQATKSLVVPKKGNYLFHYSVSPESLSLTDCKDSTVCYDCLYDLTVTINDNCSNGQFGGHPKIISLKNFSLFKTDSVTYNLDTTCTGAHIIDTSFTVNLDEGSYDVTKVLSLSREGMEYYRDSVYLAHNTCKSYEQFVQDELDTLRSHMDCTPDSLTTNLVLASKDQMLADMTPVSGQYAQYPPDNCFSIFNFGPANKYYYQSDDITYLDENGNPESPRPQALSPEDFIGNFKDSWAGALLKFHPEYRLLLEYQKLQSAYSWEADFFNTQTYAAAVAKGYLNPSGSTTQPASRFTVSGKLDSLFIALDVSDPSIVSTAKSTINGYLFNFLQNNQGSSPATYYNIWGLSTGVVKCNAKVKACFDHWSENANAFNTDSLCTGDLDEAWRIFRAEYLKIREDWIDNYTRTKSGVYPYTIHCMPVFPDRNFSSYSGGPNYQPYTGTAADTAAALANLDSFLIGNCRAFAMKWWQDLAPCGYDSTDSATILPLLIQVAYEGADANHPFGSSTVKPSSTDTVRSFDQVITEYNAIHYLTMNPVTCNAYLIPYPKPYDQSVSIVNMPIITAPDSCSCSRINELYNTYISQQPVYHSFSNYMLVAQGTHISEGALDTLRNLCSIHTTCTYLEHPINLPPALQCNVGDVCVSCAAVRNVYDSFKVRFSSVVPDNNENDSVQRLKNRLFANFMNAHLGFSKTTQEYLDFIAQCDSLEPLPSATCDSLQQLVDEYTKIREEIANGTAAGGFRITPIKDEIIESINGLLEVEHGNHLNSTLSPRYGYTAMNYTLTNKLFTVTSNLVGTSNERYGIIAPINSKYVNSGDASISGRIQRFTNAINVTSDDFVGTSTATDLTKKYYAATMALFKDSVYMHIWGGTTKTWGAHQEDTTDKCRPNLTLYYNLQAPMAKYLDDSLGAPVVDSPQIINCHSYNCDYYWFAFAYPIAGISSYSTYHTLINNQNVKLAYYNLAYPLANVKKVLSFTLDTTVIRLYKQSTGFGIPNGIDGNFIKVKLLLTDNSQADSWLVANTCTNVNYKYLEVVDTNIYNPNCQLGFAAYYNSKKSTHYTFQQIDSIYLATCGKPLNVCNVNPCDSSSWRVYNPGNAEEISHGMYSNAYDNISSDSLFHTSNFNSPTLAQAGQYVLINTKDSVNVGSATMLMKWRVKLDSTSKMVNPFANRGTTAYLGANWAKDPSDSTWWIGTTSISGTDGSFIKNIGLQANSHILKVDWIKLIKSTNDSVVYVEEFGFTRGNCPSPAAQLVLCGKQPADSDIVLNMNPCADTSFDAAMGASYLYELYQQKLKGEFANAYSRKCLDAGKLESFTVAYNLAEYHYTLYYYDQAGNLIKTVPPEGVHFVRRTTWLDSVVTARSQGQVLTPVHTLATTYRYNSLNQVISQHSPDGGLSKFWYDRLGRLVVSQNAKQALDSNYSYTLYDELGRITEVGQKKQPTAMADAIARDRGSLDTWVNYSYTLNSHLVLAEQVTSTVYDKRDELLAGMVTGSGYVINGSFQKAYTLRNRVSYTRYYDLLEWNSEDGKLITEYDNGTTYSYDIHGNVDTLVHDYRTGVMQAHGLNRFKATAYKYDLISGKVNEVHYQPGMPDQFYHRYEYDAENRLTDAYITDRRQLLGIPVLEEHEARYNYYKHGPLARTVIGQQQVQGTDYAYTLQGWLKGVNSDSLLDGDGVTGSIVAKDAYRFSLNYFNTDYQAIGSTVLNVFPGHTGYMGANSADYKPLYNGNISSMIVGIPKLGETKLYNYNYDQLNRIVSMDAWKGYHNTDSLSWSGITRTDEFKERVTYDGNGNILKYLRNGNASQLKMDSLNYYYYSGTNQLKRVTDSVGDSNYTEDIDNQTSSSNYTYDAIGNLTSDVKEGITAIEWTVYGKIKKITKSGTTINYTYDVAGNRISKAVTIGGTTTTTWYVRDAQGNTMAVYTAASSALTLSEQHLYGSSRLGVWNRTVDMDAMPPPNSYTFTRGNKFFELTNHLGNVLVTVSDKKFGHDNGSGVIDYYTPDVVNANDYYPFGMLMPGRRYSAGSGYRYGFNGKENDNEVKGEGNEQDYGMRIYDPRVGRFLSLDPLTTNFPWYTPYQFAGNKPIAFVDLDGEEDRYYLVDIWLDQTNTKIETVNVQDIWQQSSNGGPWEHKPQGDKGPGVGFAVNIWSMKGNSYQPTQVADFIYTPPAKGSGGFLNALDELFGTEEGHQGGGIAMFDKEGHGSHSGLPTADFVEIMNNAGSFVEMLGMGGGIEPGSIRNILDPNKPIGEKVLSFVETLGHSIKLGSATGESINNLVEKNNDESTKSSASNTKMPVIQNSTTKPPNVTTTIRKQRNYQTETNGTGVRTSADPSKPDTTIRYIYYDKPKTAKTPTNDSTKQRGF